MKSPCLSISILLEFEEIHMGEYRAKRQYILQPMKSDSKNFAEKLQSE